MIYITGDLHGDMSRFSNKHFPNIKDMTLDDYIVVCGDVGVIWNREYVKHSNQERYGLNGLNKKNTNFIFITGNHENYDVIENMPVIEKFNGHVRQCVYENVTYDNIYFISEPTIIDIDGEHCLCIPRASSHDIQFRTPHKSWWPQENGNILEDEIFINEHIDEYFDFIFTHDCPGCMNNQGKPSGMTTYLTNTPRELFFERVRNIIDYDCWVCGHMHSDKTVTGNDSKFVICLYHSILNADEIKNEFNQRKENEKEWKRYLLNKTKGE